MAVKISEIRENLSKLPRKDLEKLVLKAATQNQDFRDFLLVNYIDKEDGEKSLFEKAKADLEVLFCKSYKGFSEELRLANMLAACNKRINEFGKICKDKSLEMDLILLVLEIPFSMPGNHFATCFTRYNQQVYLLLKKAATILRSKLHPDYHIQYAPRLNQYLEIFVNASSHLDYVYTMQKSV